MLDWFAPVDIYCERLGPEFWAEPANALSNLSFILAAVWGYVFARRADVVTPGVALALVMAGLIGVGSFLFHTFANVWSEYGDVIPIWSFVFYFVILSIYHFNGRDLGRTLRIGGTLIVVLAAVFWFTSGAVTGDGDGAAASVAGPALLNGSEQYAPALLALWVYALAAYLRGMAVRRWIFAAAATFTVSLVARTVDLHLCGVWPLGTHLLWHLLNGLMIAFILQALLRHMALEKAAG